MRRRRAAIALLAALGAGALGAISLPAADAAPAQYLFASAFGGGKLFNFDVDPDSALLTPIGSLDAAGPWVEGTVVSPDGRFVAMTNRLHAGSVSMFQRNGGGLTPVPGSPFADHGNDPVGLAFSPDGEHLYATNYDSYTVSVFDVGADGTLTPVPGSPFPARGWMNPIGVVVSPNGRYLYVTNFLTSTISIFAIGADGGLTALPGSPFLTRGLGPAGIQFTPDGHYLYVEYFFTSTVAGYAVQPDGMLSPTAQPPQSTGGVLPLYLAVTRDGGFVYVSNLFGAGGTRAGNVAGFSIGADGALTPVPGGPVSTGQLPESFAFTADLRHLFVANRISFTLTTLARAPDGSLSIAPQLPVSIGGSPGFSSLAISPSPSPVASFTASTDGQTAQFSAADSTASPGGSIAQYDWNFGDGSVLSDGGPAPTHVYPHGGTFTVTLTVTGDDGCGPESGFTGVTAACSDSTSAVKTTQLAVP